MAQMVKSLPAGWKTWVQSLGWEDPLEKEMVTHSSILAWKIPWMAEPGSYSPWGCKELDMTEWLHFITVGNKNSKYKVMKKKQKDTLNYTVIFKVVWLCGDCWQILKHPWLSLSISFNLKQISSEINFL